MVQKRKLAEARASGSCRLAANGNRAENIPEHDVSFARPDGDNLISHFVNCRCMTWSGRGPLLK